MNSFSERTGIIPVKTLQYKSMTDELRTMLWNNVIIYCFREFHQKNIMLTERDLSKNTINFFARVWMYYFKWPLDEVNKWYANNYNKLRHYFFECKWNEVYDFVEFAAKNYPDADVANKFIMICNITLNDELSAYRFVERVLVPITSETEISEVEKALQTPFSPVQARI